MKLKVGIETKSAFFVWNNHDWSVDESLWVDHGLLRHCWSPFLPWICSARWRRSPWILRRRWWGRAPSSLHRWWDSIPSAPWWRRWRASSMPSVISSVISPPISSPALWWFWSRPHSRLSLCGRSKDISRVTHLVHKQFVSAAEVLVTMENRKKFGGQIYNISHQIRGHCSPVI